jgi:hypothetical protein
VRPALPDVGTLSLFTYRVKFEGLHDLLGLKVLRRTGCSHLEPRWFDDGLSIARDFYRHTM